MKFLKKIFLSSIISINIITPLFAIESLTSQNISFVELTNLERGISALYENNLDDAFKYLNKFLEKYPNDLRAQYYLGKYYLEINENTKAVNTFKNIINFYENNKREDLDIKLYTNSIIELAYAYINLNENNLAKTLLKEKINQVTSPNTIEKFYSILGDIYYNEKNILEARNYWEAAIKTGVKNDYTLSKYYSLNKEIAYINYKEAQKYIKLKNYEKAIELLNKAIKLENSLFYAQLLNKVIEQELKQKNYESLKNKVDKANRYIKNGDYYKAFLEYRTLESIKFYADYDLQKELDIDTDEYVKLLRQIINIGFKLQEKGYKIKVIY